ncbi:hypothetical protein DFH94DRAFT_449321 [Russula ochroleuca]|uniref:Mitogen-activated protein kinase kinase kinase 1 n=1 Tax=Russula ochroleuca TaxID=152965 RepID=A0A9P5TAD0_9AGAM|nr:hypothetical protein DFH94DRAFT_449321 [Russula ochroleuca]
MGKRKSVPDEGVVNLLTSPDHDARSDPACIGASGPSSQPQPPKAQTRTTSSKSKRLRKDPESSDATPEKRAAIFKKACPKNILDRVARVMSQRFFMIDRRREGEELCEEFKVLGSTGNVYTVTIGRKPSCDCPDATHGNHCKHILFIFLKVLQVPQSSGLWYQKALLASELQSIFANAPQAPNALAHDNVRDAYARATGKAPSSTPSDSRRRIPGPEDSCPICYEDMQDISKLVFCDECGNALHTECFGQWRRRAGSAAEVTCVWCRAKWPTGVKGGAGASPTTEGYVNLGGIAGLGGERDTSSYHQSWRYGTSRNRAGRA